MSSRQFVSIVLALKPIARLTTLSCEKNYGPRIRDEDIAQDPGSGGPSVNALANDMTASAVSVDDVGVTQSSPVQAPGPINLAIGSGLYSDTTSATRSVTSPNFPYSNGSDLPCEDDSSAPATTSFSDTISFWPLPTICVDTPTLCGTGPFLWTVLAGKPKRPRMITPAAQTAHRERPQGWLAPPYPQVATSPSQTGYIRSTGAKPDISIPPSTDPVHITPKVPTAHFKGATQDPQAAHLEHPALNLDIPRHGRVRRSFPSHDQVPEALPMELAARAKIPKPQPQTARAMTTLGALLGGPRIGGPENGHPVSAGSSAGKLNDREEDEQIPAADEETDTSTDSIWDSHGNHVRGPADGSMVALMATISLAVVLLMLL